MTDVTGDPPNTTKCVFSLSGRDFDPEECLRETGLVGAEIWRQRHAHLVHRRDLANVALRVSVGPEHFESTEDAVRLVLAQIAPATEGIVAYAAKRGLKRTMTCMIKLYTDRTLYELSPESMRAMAALGAEFSIDLIDLRPDE